MGFCVFDGALDGVRIAKAFIKTFTPSVHVPRRADRTGLLRLAANDIANEGSYSITFKSLKAAFDISSFYFYMKS